MALDIKSQTKEWIEDNPLRIWRKSNGLSMRDLAANIGVNLMSVQGWEVGNSFPNPENMASIVQLTNDLDLPRRWFEWYKIGPNRGNKIRSK